ncbi:MAG: 1-deoxy-D-xylulose-5-phosphate synthase [Bacilli bacterium]|nr:1-deoxy-D-xylulose-5-phosphate synthase [Bacilli bacterium]
MKKEKRTFNLDTPLDPKLVKELDNEELQALSDAIREKIIDSVSKTGGHLSGNLGVVELTTAIHKYFDLPNDKLIFDVGHQSYAHKILSGRTLDNLRKEDGVDGFQKRNESEYDPYEAGHSSTAISAAMGMAVARDMKGEDYRIVAVVGDASIANGLSFEAMNNLESFNHKLIIVLNNNEMAITQPVGGFHRLLESVRVSRRYIRGKTRYKAVMGRTKFGRWFYKVSAKIKGFLANLFYRGNIFIDMGLYYYGVVDGHNIKKLLKAFKKIDNINAPIILHVKTVKGKGYAPAENDNSGIWHGVGPFDKETGTIPAKNDKSWANIYAELLENEMDANKNVVSITPAMGYGSSLQNIENKFPDRFYDVGISEEHALVFASGLANSGIHPYVTIYSTFLQRAYDELAHDAARMDLPVTIMVDHAGLVGEDGETHQGIYDYAYLRTIPNVAIAMASDEKDAKRLFEFSKTYEHPLAIRFPRGNLLENKEEQTPVNLGEWDIIQEGKDTAIISYGPHIQELKGKVDATIINTLFLYPMDEEVLRSLLLYKGVIIYDPYGVEIGFAQDVECALRRLGYKGMITIKAIPNEFVAKGTVLQQEKRYGVDVESIITLLGN